MLLFLLLMIIMMKFSELSSSVTYVEVKELGCQVFEAIIKKNL
jgi:hypothetical protein